MNVIEWHVLFTQNLLYEQRVICYIPVLSYSKATACDGCVSGLDANHITSNFDEQLSSHSV